MYDFYAGFEVHIVATEEYKYHFAVCIVVTDVLGSVKTDQPDYMASNMRNSYC
jgi:hypothetical protein